MSGLNSYGQMGPHVAVEQDTPKNSRYNTGFAADAHSYEKTEYDLSAHQQTACDAYSNIGGNMSTNSPVPRLAPDAALTLDSGFKSTRKTYSDGVTPKTKDELIMDLRIQLAVLQNDLQHTRQENNTLKSSLSIVVQSFSQGLYRTPPADPGFAKGSIPQRNFPQIEDLNMKAFHDNAQLSAQFQQNFEAHQKTTGSKARTTTTEQQETDLNLADTREISLLQVQDDSFNTETTNPFSFSSGGDPDIGMKSLEEVFGEDAASVAEELDLGSSSQELLHRSMGEEQARDIDEQLADFENDLLTGKAAPAPRVFKVGFELDGFLGERYIPSVSLPIRIGETYDRSKSRHDQNWSRFPANASTGPRTQRAGEDHVGPYEDEGEREAVTRTHTKSWNRDDLHSPGFFKHGITYIPAAGDINFFRTIHIGNLPVSITLRDVLNRVRGGDVSSALLLNTTKILGCMSARIVFRDEVAAEEYVSWTKIQPVCFPSDDDEEVMVSATIELINTPTYPKARDRHPSITRCLSIPNMPTRVRLRQMEQDLIGQPLLRADGLVEWFLDENQTLNLEFSGTENAELAFGILTRSPLYRGCEIRRAEDPCSGPMEELLEEPKPRPPMFPRLLNISKLDGNLGDGREADGSVGDGQRKQLAALTNQKVEIPSFSGMALKGPSWADEVEHEEEDIADHLSPSSIVPAVPVTSPENDRTETLANPSADIEVDVLTKHNPGLAGSRWAFAPTTTRSRAGSNYFSNQKTPEANHSQNFAQPSTKATAGSDFSSKDGATGGDELFQDCENGLLSVEDGLSTPPRTRLNDLMASPSSDGAKTDSSSAKPKSDSQSVDTHSVQNSHSNRVFKEENDDVFTPERQPFGPPCIQNCGSLSYFGNGIEELESSDSVVENPDEIDLGLDDEGETADEHEEPKSPASNGKSSSVIDFVAIGVNSDMKLLKAVSPFSAFISAYSAGTGKKTSDEVSEEVVKVGNAESTSFGDDGATES